MSDASAKPAPTKSEDWHEGFSAGWDSAQPHLRAGLIELRLDSLAPTQMANTRKHFDRLGVPYIVIYSSELRIDYSALVASAPPAAERIAMQALREYCIRQRKDFEEGVREKPTHPRARDWSIYAVAYTDIINQIDAQERAGAKAE